MKSLDEQIEELKKEHNFKSEMETLFGQYEYLAYVHDCKESDFTITLQLRKYAFPELIENVLKGIITTLPVTNTQTKLSDIAVSYSPFRFDYQNNINDNYVLLSYYSNRIHVRIEIPISFYEAINKRDFRKVYDSELHYFGGISQRQINEMRILKYTSQYFDTINWYGGDVSVYCKSDEMTEQFNEMVLTGKHI